MRFAIAILIAWACVIGAHGQEKKLKTRYDITVDEEAYPQKTPKDALTSVLKAIQGKKIDYLLAQLSDPQYVDEHVQRANKGKFDDMVKEVTQYLLDDSDTVPQLRRFIKEGEWEDGEETASVKLKDSKPRMFFRKLEGRWFLENRKEAKK